MTLSLVPIWRITPDTCQVEEYGPWFSRYAPAKLKNSPDTHWFSIFLISSYLILKELQENLSDSVRQAKNNKRNLASLPSQLTKMDMFFYLGYLWIVSYFWKYQRIFKHGKKCIFYSIFLKIGPLDGIGKYVKLNSEYLIPNDFLI